ncbi:MAG: hypothetical protein SGILL_005541 [Bacillariaceae sp.]
MNRCVDCAMGALQTSNLQDFMLGYSNPKTLAMVGGPAPDISQGQLRGGGSLISVESDERMMYWPVDQQGPNQRTSYILHDTNRRRAKPASGILKQKKLSVQPETSMFRQLFEPESKHNSSYELHSTDGEYSTSTGSRSLSTAEASSIAASTEDFHPCEPSGKRPESPIKLFSSQEFDDDDANDIDLGESSAEAPIIKTPVIESSIDDFESITNVAESNIDRAIPQGLNSQDPIIVDDYRFEEDESREPYDDEGRDGEERDQPPTDPSLVDFRPIASTHHSHVPLSRTLLYSMRSRNRDIDNLLAELPTKYSFGRSYDDVSTDDLSANGDSSTSSLENSIDSTKEFPSKDQSNGKEEKKNFKFISFSETKSASQYKTTEVDYRQKDAALRILELGL